jgi:hypothetical protein
MADKDKSVLDKFVDTFQEVLGSVVKVAATPTEKTHQTRVAGSANEQVYIPEANDAVAVTATNVRRKAPAKKAKSAARAPKKPNSAKRTAPKASKRKAPKRAKSSVRKAGGKDVARKAAKKKVTVKRAAVKKAAAKTLHKKAGKKRRR